MSNEITFYRRWGSNDLKTNSEYLQKTAEFVKVAGSVEDNNHNLPHPVQESLSRVLETMESKHPGITKYGTANRNFVDKVMGDDDAGTGEKRRMMGQLVSSPNSGAPFSSGSALFKTRRPYQPEWDDPSRSDFPLQRRTTNTYMRMFYKFDETIPNCIDLMSSLPFSDFQLTGEGVEGEVKEKMETSIHNTKLLSKLPEMAKERYIVGEAIPSMHWDNAKSVWTHLFLMNPDQLNVVYSPFVNMEPIIEFIPDRKLQNYVKQTDAMSQQYLDTMPSEVVQALRAGRNLPMSPMTTSLLAHRLHDYDTRGTSILTRCWAAFELGDAYRNASLQTARRLSGPIKALLLGDGQGNLPSAQEEARLHGLLAQAEADPVGHWIIWNNQVKHEMWGAPERVLGLAQHYDLLERMKLAALGLPKSVINGDGNYSSAAAGLTVFLQKLLALRDYFVTEWLTPKFFLPMAVINDWRKPNKKSQQTRQKRAEFLKTGTFLDVDASDYILPTVIWSKPLDSKVDKERMDALTQLETQLGVKLTDKTKLACMGIDAEEEWKQKIEEVKAKLNLAGNDPRLQAALGLTGEDQGAGGGGSSGLGGGMSSPAIGNEEFGLPGAEGAPGLPGAPGEAGSAPTPSDAGGETTEAPPPAPKGASLEVDADKGSSAKSSVPQRTAQPTSNKYWSSSLVTPVKQLFDSFDVNVLEDVEPWSYVLKDKDVRQAINSRSSIELWHALEDWLLLEGYPNDQILELKRNLNGHIKSARLHEDEHQADGPTNVLQLARQHVGKLDESDDVNFYVGK